jgi:hypothetical protein
LDALAATWAVICVLSLSLEQLDLAMPFRCVEMPLSECLADLEAWGVAVNDRLLADLRLRVEDRMCLLEEVLFLGLRARARFLCFSQPCNGSVCNGCVYTARAHSFFCMDVMRGWRGGS